VFYIGMPGSGKTYLMGAPILGHYSAIDIDSVCVKVGNRWLADVSRLTGFSEYVIGGTCDNMSDVLRMYPEHDVQLVVPSVTQLRATYLQRSVDTSNLFQDVYVKLALLDSDMLFGRILTYKRAMHALVKQARPQCGQIAMVKGNMGGTASTPSGVYVDTESKAEALPMDTRQQSPRVHV
jgi:hypothetical protein